MPKRNKTYHMIVSYLARDVYEIKAYNEEDAENLILAQLNEEGFDSPEVDSVWEANESEVTMPENMVLIEDE